VSVKTWRLDDFKFKKKPTLAVLDCEASEVDALKGGEVLFKNLRLVVVEAHKDLKGVTTEKACAKLLRTYGFNVERVVHTFFTHYPVKREVNEVWLVGRRVKA
jgi:hypothetical protein